MYKSYLENVNTYALFILRDHEDFLCMYIHHIVKMIE